MLQSRNPGVRQFVLLVSLQLLAVSFELSAFWHAARAADLIPPASALKPDRPRLLLRPADTPYAISVAQLRALPRDADFNQMLAQLKAQDHAAAQAMVWLLTAGHQPEVGRAAAERAVKRMRAYRYPGNVDTFHIFGRLSEFGLAYDWLYNCPQFTPEIKAEIRRNVAPLAHEGIRVSNDHMFHNYIWMSAGGVALWALATAGEDQPSDAIFEQIRQRFNNGLYPAWRYLDGLPSEPMGYWSLYVFTPGVWTLLAAQSACETDLVAAVRTQRPDQRDQSFASVPVGARYPGWLDRHFENLIHSTLPDMRYIPWGDLQGGPNGGVTHEMAGVIDAATWALQSPHGAWFSGWLAGKRGLQRFYGETPIFWMLYTSHLKAQPAGVPGTDRRLVGSPLSFLAGNRQGGHFVARSAWDDDATIVAFRCTDHFGDHHHYDQGSFIIYRHGLLAVDPPVYRTVRGPQQKTEHHNTLLIGGQPQRPVRGQWFTTVEEFQKNLQGGRKLETGDVLFHRDAGTWAAVAGQFAQAYDCQSLRSCVRQLLFIRPDKVVVVDQLSAVPDDQPPVGARHLPEVQWLLQLPGPPQVEGGSVLASNGKSWLRCQAVLPAGVTPVVDATPVNTHRLSFRYPGQDKLVLVHLLDVGDGVTAGPPPKTNAVQTARGIEVTVNGQTFVFSAEADFKVVGRQD